MRQRQETGDRRKGQGMGDRRKGQGMGDRRKGQGMGDRRKGQGQWTVLWFRSQPLGDSAMYSYSTLEPV